MGGELGITGNRAVFGPIASFEGWKGKSPPAPKGLGFATVKQATLVVFNDSEQTLVLPDGEGVVLLQQVAGIDKPARYVKKLPKVGWTVVKGTYRSEGGEHVLFDAMYSAADYADDAQAGEIKTESGVPMRVKLARGDYRLEVLGTWRPDASTEFSVARLVPSSAPLPKPTPKTESKPAAKKSAKAMELKYVPGRFPGPLPTPEGEHAALLAYLHDQEQAFLQSDKLAYAAFETETKAVSSGKRMWTPAQAAALASTMTPIDLGEQPANPDRSLVKGMAQWKQQDKEFDALSERKFARSRVWCLLLTLIGKDSELKRQWMKIMETVDDAWHRNWLTQHLTNAS